MTLYEEIIKESTKAKKKFGPYNSTHELYSVLSEEIEEYWQFVKMSKQDGVYKKRMIEELIQIAAVSIRGIQELENDEILWV